MYGSGGVPRLPFVGFADVKQHGVASAVGGVAVAGACGCLLHGHAARAALTSSENAHVGFSLLFPISVRKIGRAGAASGAVRGSTW